MGWLWATPSPPKSPSPGQGQESSTGSQPSASSTATQQQSAGSNNDQIDPELQKFISLFQTDTGSKPEEKTSSSQSPQSTSETTKASSASSSSSSSSSWFALKSSPTAPSQTTGRTLHPEAATESLSPVAESLLPTEMSCRQAFDMAFYCQSVGGQWNAIYREGSMRSCSDHWNDFFFCMRVKGYAGDVRAREVREHYRRKEAAKYGGGMPSSEDVWTARKERVPEGTEFTAKLEDPENVSDEDWREGEMERRRKIREKLGIGSKITAS